jgi:hydroxymethylpyrimidine pyrophosphatase-like HAD family hydrolase
VQLTKPLKEHLLRFFTDTLFTEKGAVITDLDGTAIHEWEGRYGVPIHVEQGLKAIYATGRPVVLNTLRFPLSVMRTFGREWYKLSAAPIATVLLNGSMVGYIHEDASGQQRYEELDAWPLCSEDLDEVLDIVRHISGDGVSNLLVFYYPRNWQQGEIIWTAHQEKTAEVQEKYGSAERVWCSTIDELEAELRGQEICMIHLYADTPGDERMAYQHTRRRDFFTRSGVDKLWGAEQIGRILGFSLEASLGAGDTSMDTFLRGVGLAVHVGRTLDYHGALPSLLVSGSEEFAALLMELAALQSDANKHIAS